jgi:hypothetical protein
MIISLILLQACDVDDMKGAGKMARWRVKMGRVEMDQNGFRS